MLPVIQIEDFLKAEGATRRRIAEDIGKAAEELGFLYVAGHGIAQETIEAALGAVETFFSLPMAEKQKSARRRGTYRGYIATMPFAQDKISGEEVLYEAYIVGGEGEGEMVWPNIWPGEPATFRAAVWPYYQAVERLNLQLLRAFALTLGQGEETFVQHFRQPLSNMSLLHYPGRKPGTPKPDTNDHRDTNTLTVLMPSKVGGLEVQMKSGAFAEVEPIPGCFVVNIGNMMETWSGGRFPSTMHRVLPPEGVERYSMAFFGTPDADTEIFPVGESRLDFMPHRAGDDFARFIAQFDG